jgi:hypothetical protein
MLDDYIQINKYLFVHLSTTALLNLLSVPGVVQYESFSGLLMRYNKLSKKDKLFIHNTIFNSPNPWVGASVGQLTKKDHEVRIIKT